MTGSRSTCYQRCDRAAQTYGTCLSLPDFPSEAALTEVAAKSLSAHVSGPLRGRLKPPGDKSISHRALILGLLSIGETEIEGLLEGDDVLRTAAACRALGAEVERLDEGRWRVRGCGIGSLLAPRDPLDFGNSGTGMRLMMGVVGGHAMTAWFDGDASLRKRPMRRILDPLILMGAEVLSEARADAARSYSRARANRFRSSTSRRSPPRRSSRLSSLRDSIRPDARP